MAHSPLLSITGLTLRFGAISALQNFSLSVEPGTICTLLGANGAGKSSTLRCIAGLERPSAGDITFRGRSIVRRPPHEAARDGIALVPEGRHVYPHLSVLENLHCGFVSTSRGAARRKEQSSRVDGVLDLFPELADRLKQKGGSLSGGQQQMLVVARGLMSNPELLMLDEPSLGVAPTVVARLYEQLGVLKANGVTILLVEQFAKLALGVADYAAVLANGALVAEGSPASLRDDPRLLAAYLS